jgi:methylated-DNA-protein-cysteine methyltransferase related protein
MPKAESEFRDKVYETVSQIPTGRVMTYGDIALLSGHPTAARIVGQIAHFGPAHLPWHRVVNRFGGLASGYYDGRKGQKRMLEAEGIAVGEDYTVSDFVEKRWYPIA